MRAIKTTTRGVALASTLLLAHVDFAMADGMPGVTLGQAPAAASYNWAGFYVGLNGGGNFDQSRTMSRDGNGAIVSELTPVPGTTAESRGHGGLFGATAGYNFVMGSHIVLGVEGDFDGSASEGSNTFCNATGCSMSHSQQEWFATLRGRVGYAFDHVLVYGTGGAMWERSHTDRVRVQDGLSARTTDTESGWIAGGGVEIALLRNLSVKGEYLHAEHDVNGAFLYPTLGAASQRYSSGTATEDIWRIGLNIKLFDRREVSEPLK